MANSNVIVVKDLVKRYKKAKENAVDAISFDVKKGEFFSFLGPNGAGKTTTISILTTLLSKTSGTILVAGHDIQKDSTKVRKNIGIIFQNPSLDQNLTAEENIRFHATLYGEYSFRPLYSLMPKKYQNRVAELSQILGIEEEVFKPIKTFSGGMKRKLEIIRSLMHHPRILFLDEPTTGLDPASRKNLWEYLQHVRKKENITIFLTTHYLEEAEGADRIAVINKGKIVTIGTPSKIKSDLVEEFLLINSKTREDLLIELKRKKIPYKQEDEAIKLSLKSTSVHTLLRSIETPLDSVTIHTPTLEEAYLEIIGGKNNA